jgi:uncharacterized protein YdhG (YjbR/CyaY superfamily)
MDVFSEFLAKIDDPAQRARTEEVLRWVGERFPNLAPRVAWNQPMFTDHGTFIIGFSIAKGHLAVAPEKVALDRFAEEIAQSGYVYSKMIYRIPWNKPVDWSLLERIIAFNIEDKAETATFWRK